jgi:hypothetical protein
MTALIALATAFILILPASMLIIARKIIDLLTLFITFSAVKVIRNVCLGNLLETRRVVCAFGVVRHDFLLTAY